MARVDLRDARSAVRTSMVTMERTIAPMKRVVGRTGKGMNLVVGTMQVAAGLTQDLLHIPEAGSSRRTAGTVPPMRERSTAICRIRLDMGLDGVTSVASSIVDGNSRSKVFR